MRSTLRLAACLAVCLAIGFVGSQSTASAISTWYVQLTKPPGTPPNWVFPVVWTTLYVLMALAWWLLWDRADGSTTRRTAIALFMVQLGLNASWSPVFFGAKAVGAGLLIIIAMVFATATTIAVAWRANRLAAFLLLPYLAWISYATYLNAGILAFNP